LEPQDAARVGALDYFGVVSAGARHPDLGPLLQHVSKTYAAGPSTAIGLPTPFVAEAAAYVNAAAGHMHDYDDHHDTVGGHPTVVVLPAALAVGESVGADVDEIVCAYAVGVETMCALGRCSTTHITNAAGIRRRRWASSARPRRLLG